MQGRGREEGGGQGEKREGKEKGGMEVASEGVGRRDRRERGKGGNGKKEQ